MATFCKRNIWLLFALLLLNSCASKYPRTFPLDSNFVPSARQQFEKFLTEPCPTSLDADVTLQWRYLAGGMAIASIVQLQEPSSLRYSNLDPLGRPLFLLIADNNRLTAIDNKNAEAFTAVAGSSMWENYVPEAFTLEDVLPLFLGRLSSKNWVDERIEQDVEDAGFLWFIFEYRSGVTSYVLFDTEKNRIKKHLLYDDSDTSFLQLTYNHSLENGMQSCPIPEEIAVAGKHINGTITLRYERIISRDPLPDTLFQITIPDHYRVRHYK